MADLTALDSTINIAMSSGEGLPPETKPKGCLVNVVRSETWESCIFDPEPQPAKVEEKKSEIKYKSLRRSLFGPKSSAAKEEQDHPGAASESLESEEDYWCLSFFQSSMVATILEDTITELRILLECNNSLRIEKAMVDMSLLLAIKYNIKQPVITDELAGIDPKKLHCMSYKLNKLDADRKLAVDLFTNLYIELSTDKCFLSLFDFLRMVQDRADHAVYIEEEEAKNRVLRKELAKQLRIQRNHHKTVAYDAEVLINTLKAQVEDSSLLLETKGRYVDNWQSARTEQHQQIILEKETLSTGSMEYYKRRSDHESRVHSEVESLTTIVINETLKSIEEWMEKYETDMEKIDLRIQIQKSDYQNMYDKRRNLEDTYAKRDKEIKAWIKFKDDREQAQLYAKTMTKSAIIVQAWWRGLLVRKQLGPYRQKKKGKVKK